MATNSNHLTEYICWRRQAKCFFKSENRRVFCTCILKWRKDDGLFGYTDVAKVFDKSVTISGRGTIGFSCVRNEPYVPIVRLITVVPCAGIDLQYLHFVFTALFEQGVGTSIQQLTVPMLQVKLIPVPPLVEQHRIVQRIEELLPLVKGL